MVTRAQRDAILLALIDTGGPWDPAATYVGVYESIAAHGLDTVIGDVTVGTGDIATRQAVTTWGTPYDMTDGSRVVDAPLMQFRPGVGESGTVRGWYVASAATAGTLKQWGAYGSDILMPDDERAVDVVLRVKVDPNGEWDATIVWNG